MKKYLILILVMTPLLCLSQRGEGRLGNITEHQAHVIGGAGISILYYETTRPKNNLNLKPKDYQNQELKQGLRTMFVVVGASTVIEVSDYYKGGKFDYSDWGATITAGLFTVMFQCLGRMIIQDRRDWRRRGLRLRLGN